MQPLLRGIFVSVALAVLSVSAVGCDDADYGFKLEFTEFDTSDVEGIRLWKFDAGRRVWFETLELEFGDTVYRGGIEFQTYTAPFGPGGSYVDLFTKLIRFDHRDAVRMSFGSLRLSKGSYKISAFNVAGDSPLSVDTLIVSAS